MGAWHESEEPLLKIECEFQPICPHCHIPVKLYTAKILRFKLDAERGKCGHAIDVECVCPKCRHWEVQGVPISAEHYQEASETVKELCKGDNTEEGEGSQVGKDA